MNGDELLFDQTQRAGFYELEISEAVDATAEEESLSDTSSSTEESGGIVWSINLADATESHIGTDPAVEDLLDESVTPSGCCALALPAVGLLGILRRWVECRRMVLVSTQKNRLR